MDNLFLTACSLKECQQDTGLLLKMLWKLGYHISANKAQLCSNRVITYLGYCLESGNRTLSSSRIQAILNIPESQDKRQVSILGYCCILQSMDTTLQKKKIARLLYQSLEELRKHRRGIPKTLGGFDVRLSTQAT